MMATILFLSHNAGRTGAPMVLLHLLRWLRANTDYGLQVLFKEGGALLDEFSAVAETTCLAAVDRRVRRNLVQRALRKSGLAYRQDYRHNPVQGLYPAGKIDLVYVNSVAGGELLPLVDHLPCPVLAHVHELGTWIRRFGEANWERIRNRTTAYVAVSEAVSRHLTERCGVAADLVHLAYEFSDLPDRANLGSARARIRQELGIPEGGVVVGGSGAETWRKGKDLFVQLAVRASRRAGEIPLFFLWVGGAGADWYEEHQQLLHDVETAGIGDRIKIMPHVDNPHDYYAAFDIFAMTSREDPYPLVNIEVAALGVPIVCFDKSGGSPELVGDDAGFVVPYLDVETMHDKIASLASNPTFRHQLGRRAAAKAAEHSVEKGAARLATIIKSVVSAHAS